MSSNETSVAVALLYETRASGAELREVLTSFGAPVVYEALASALDRDELERSHANVVVVNLDAQNDPALDGVYDLLDDSRYRVVFNESEVSRGLSGFDHARWVRHLAAKVLGADIDPPRPAGAEPVPTPVPSAVPATVKTVAAPVREKSDPETKAAPAAKLDLSEFAVANDETLKAPVSDISPDPVDLFDFDNLIEMPEVAPRVPDSSTLSRESAEPALPAPEMSNAFDIDFSDESNEFLTGEANVHGLHAAELGTGLKLDQAGIDAGLESAPVPRTSAQDLDLDFDLDLDLDAHAAVPVAVGIEPSAAAAELGASTSWSLEHVFGDGDLPQEVPTGRADFGIEKLRAEEFLAPETKDQPEEEFAPPSSGLSLELIPLEEAVSPTRGPALDHENWLDPDAVVVPKANVRQVWVLGASIGGPEAVREFLAGIPRDYPALFLLAQHLGDEFVGMMTNQLTQATKLTVRAPTHGERVAHGDVVVVPNSHRLQVDPEGVVVLERITTASAFSPSIDRVLQDVADRFGGNAGAIIFSGMSSDAAEGSRYLAEKGGLVYAQRPDTCVVSSMIDGVCETGVVSFLGSPQELAEKLLEAKAS